MAPIGWARVTVATLVAAAAVLAAAAAAPTAACRCPPPKTVAAAAAAADHVVVVRVTRKVLLPHRAAAFDGWAGRVTASFKGCTPRAVTLQLPTVASLCGPTPKVGGTYLLTLPAAAVGRRGSVRLQGCNFGRPWAAVAEGDRRALRRLNPLVCPRAPAAPYH